MGKEPDRNIDGGPGGISGIGVAGEPIELVSDYVGVDRRVCVGVAANLERVGEIG